MPYIFAINSLKSFAKKESTVTFADTKFGMWRSLAPKYFSRVLDFLKIKVLENRDSVLVWGTRGRSLYKMKFFVYILESKIDNSFYIGQTSNIEERIVSHNKGYNRSTKSKRPWKVIYTEECSSRSEAMKLEKKIKSWKKRDVIKGYIGKK